MSAFRVPINNFSAIQPASGLYSDRAAIYVLSKLQKKSHYLITDQSDPAVLFGRSRVTVPHNGLTEFTSTNSYGAQVHNLHVIIPIVCKCNARYFNIFIKSDFENCKSA